MVKYYAVQYYSTADHALKNSEGVYSSICIFSKKIHRDEFVKALPTSREAVSRNDIHRHRNLSRADFRELVRTHARLATWPWIGETRYAIVNGYCVGTTKHLCIENTLACKEML